MRGNAIYRQDWCFPGQLTVTRFGRHCLTFTQDGRTRALTRDEAAKLIRSVRAALRELYQMHGPGFFPRVTRCLAIEKEIANHAE